MKASDLFVKCLEEEGVEFIYGVPGEENLDMLESMRNSNVKLILTRHEQAAGFMATTYGRLTGKPILSISQSRGSSRKGDEQRHRDGAQHDSEIERQRTALGRGGDAAGALQTEAVPASNEIHVSNDGPLYASGDLSIDGASEDMHSVKRRAALCRCGASKNKPFCDNSHRELGFQDAGAVGDTGLPKIESGGPLTVKRIPDGPLEVSGNFTLRAGSGRVAWSGRKAYLCRCGRSANKPFCDGAHKEAGFKVD